LRQSGLDVLDEAVRSKGWGKMKKSRYTEEQIAYALKQAEVGTAVPEICRKLGIAEQTFYRWRSKYAGMLSGDLKRFKQLEEKSKFKKLAAG